MKKLVFATLILCGSTVFAIDGDYSCQDLSRNPFGPMGLRIKGEEVKFHAQTLKVCDKQGVLLILQDKCSREERELYFVFDSITLFLNGHGSSWQCKKLR